MGEREERGGQWTGLPACRLRRELDACRSDSFITIDRAAATVGLIEPSARMPEREQFSNAFSNILIAIDAIGLCTCQEDKNNLFRKTPFEDRA